MRQEHVRERGKKAIRRNCLAGAELKTEDKIGGFGTKCGFRFSKALLPTAQPPLVTPFLGDAKKVFSS